MYLWQDHGILGVFDPATGWCRADADRHEPGGVRGVACDVIPGGEDVIAWLGVGWIAVLVTGFYLWYWPGVRRWATASIAPPYEATGTWSAWVTRGFDPWTGEGGAGNTWVLVDAYSGDVVYDGTPGAGNAFDQAWDDWSFRCTPVTSSAPRRGWRGSPSGRAHSCSGSPAWPCT